MDRYRAARSAAAASAARPHCSAANVMVAPAAVAIEPPVSTPAALPPDDTPGPTRR